MFRRNIYLILGFTLLTLILVLSGCNLFKSSQKEQKETVATNEQVQEQATAQQQFSETQSEIQKKIQQQQQKLEQLEKKIQQEKEIANLKAEIAQQKSELESLKREAQSKKIQSTQKTKTATLSTGNELTEEEQLKQKQAAIAKRRALRVHKITIPEGTRLIVRLENSLSTKENKFGDTFVATLEKSVRVEGEKILPVGTKVWGQVVSSRPSGKVSGKARMAIKLIKVEYRGKKVSLRTNTLRFEAQGTTKRDVAIIGGGSGLGAIIGGVIGGKKGAAIGALLGGGAGTAAVLKTAGKEVVFEPETKFQFELTDDLVLKK